MELKKLPIPYIYAILAGIGLALFFGLRRYLTLMYWDEIEYFSWRKDFIVPLVNYSLWGLLLPIVYYFVKKYHINTFRAKELFIAFLASLVMAIIHELTSNIMFYLPMHLSGYMPFTEKMLNFIIKATPTALFTRLIEYWVLYTFLTFLDTRRELRKKKLEFIKLESQLTGAQLNALRLQLQPHFLFNTLNTISSLMVFDVKKAQKMVSQLGSLLRTVLDENTKKTISLREELEFVKSYLAIEQVRFMDRLKIRYQLDEGSLDAMVPSLILQPLVENAIKHGFSNKIEEGIITVSSKKIDDQIQLSVKDDGQGTDYQIQELTTKGIGLKNVRQRLDLIYAKAYNLEIVSQTGQGFEIVITIPYHNQPA